MGFDIVTNNCNKGFISNKEEVITELNSTKIQKADSKMKLY